MAVEFIELEREEIGKNLNKHKMIHPMITVVPTSIGKDMSLPVKLQSL